MRKSANVQIEIPDNLKEGREKSRPFFYKYNMRIFEIISPESFSTKTYFHGTNSLEPFVIFDEKYTGEIGFHFTDDIEKARSFGHSIIKAKLSMKKSANSDEWKSALEQSRGGNPRRMAINILRQQGFDSVITSYEVIVFDADQIKICGYEGF